MGIMKLRVPTDTSIFTNILVGGILSTLCYLTWQKKIGNCYETENIEDKVTGIISKYPCLYSDRHLCAVLEEPITLFMQINESATRNLLQNVDNLLSIFVNLLQGCAKPSLVASVLKARRATTNHLYILIKEAKRKRPLEVSDMQEDFKVINTSLDNLVHNCMQQSNLNIMLKE